VMIFTEEVKRTCANRVPSAVSAMTTTSRIHA
jgi:hypothetical protein